MTLNETLKQLKVLGNEKTRERQTNCQPKRDSENSKPIKLELKRANKDR